MRDCEQSYIKDGSECVKRQGNRMLKYNIIYNKTINNIVRDYHS
jgi:hypothetical protein